MKRTGIITYNVNTRGRKHLGKDRVFDTAGLAKLVNSPAVQERVKHGDMLGYYGHWPRVKFGMNPQEGGIVGGKVVSIEPAVRTVHLKAMPDGTIEHEEEFLDTESGKLALRMFNSKAGGFSSAIEARPAGNMHVANGFFGFDYVFEPNYSTNRGYSAMLDSCTEDELAMFDDVRAYQGMLEGTNLILDRIQADYDSLLASHARLLEENEVLTGMLASNHDGKVPMLDSLVQVVHGNKPIHFEAADDFLRETLPTVKDKDSGPAKKNAADTYLDRRFS